MAIRMKSGTKFQRGGGEKGSLLHCWWECKPVQPLREVVWNCLRIFRIHLPHDPGTPLWHIYPKNLQSLMHRDPCTTVLTTALLLISKTGKPPWCPSRDKKDGL